MENYFTTQRDNVFRNVEVLIYVFDVESREVEKDMHYYQSCLEAILQVSRLQSMPPYCISILSVVSFFFSHNTYVTCIYTLSLCLPVHQVERPLFV